MNYQRSDRKFNRQKEPFFLWQTFSGTRAYVHPSACRYCLKITAGSASLKKKNAVGHSRAVSPILESCVMRFYITPFQPVLFLQRLLRLVTQPYCKVIPCPISWAARPCYVIGDSVCDLFSATVGGTWALRWIYYAGHLGESRVRLHVTVGIVLRERGVV